MDKESFVGQVSGLRERLYRIAASYLKAENDRLDAISEAVARAWEKQDSLRDERFFATWLTRILINECIGVQRRQKREQPTDALPEAAGEPEDSRVQVLRAAVEKLQQRQRTMVVLHYMEGMDVQEIAQIMGTTKGAVCAGLSRARESLRRMMEEEVE